MREKLLSKLMLLLAFLLVGASNAWADTTKTSTLTFTAKCEGSGTADDGVKWTVESDGAESNFDNSKGIHYGTSGAAVQAIKLSTNGISGTITKIVVNASTASGVSASLYATVNGVAFGTQEQAVSATATEYTFEGSAASGLIEVKLAKPESANKALYIKSVAVTYTTSGNEPPVMQTVATPTFNPAAGEVEAGTEVTIATTTEGAAIYYTVDGTDPTTNSTKGNTVKVDKAMTIKAIAVKEGMNNSAVATATYTIKAAVVPVEGEFVLYTGAITPGDYIIYYDGKAMKAGTASNRFQYEEVVPENNTIINPDEGIVWTLAASDEYYTLYNASTGKYAASTGTKNQGALFEDGTDDKALWTVTVTDENTYEFVNKHNAEANVNANLRNNTTYGFACYSTTTGGALSLYKKSDGTQPTPETAKETIVTIDATGITNTNLFEGENAGKLTAVVKTVSGEVIEGAVVSWESSDENVADVANDGTVTLVGAGTTVITATYAEVENKYMESSATYSLTVTNEDPNGPGTADNPYTVAKAVAYIATLEGTSPEEVYVTGIISQVDSYNSTYKSITYWISDDGTTESQMQVYSGKGIESAEFSGKDDLKKGDKVTVCGKVKMFNGTPEFDKNNYLVSLERDETKQEAGLAYEETSFTINVGESFTAPELTNPNNLTVTYTSSNESVATVDANTGVVTLGNGIGVTTIKAIFKGNDNYIAGEASYTLEVIDPNVPGKTVENAYTVAQAVAAIDAGEGVTGVYVKGIISQLDSYNTTYKSITYWISADGTTTDQFEVYSGRGLDNTDFAALTDLKLGDEVVIYGNIKKYGDVYEFDKENYIVSLVRAEKQEPGLAYETTLFTINVGESFTAPELTNPNNLTVTYTSSNESVATVDANTGAVTLAGGIGVTTIKATFEGSDSYFAGEASYTLEVVDPNVPGKTVENAYTVAQARAAIDAGEGVTGVYVKGIISQLDSYNSTYKSITYWISADGTTTDQFEVYSGRGLDDTDFAALTDLKLGDEVVIYGNIKKYGDVYEFDKQNYIVSLVRTEPIEVAAPTFSVEEGEVAAGTEVKIILPEGAEYIRYTVDGTDPSEETGNGDKYADPIVITNTTTIKAIAVDANGNVSKVVSVTYTVKGDEPVDENGWVKTTWAELTPNDVFVIVGTNADGAFAMSNDNGTAKAPVPVAVTLDGAKLVSGVTENIQWTVGSSDNGYIFYPAGTTDAWLYCTNTNNGVRVGTGDASVFTVSEEGYLYNVGNNRYIGIYNSQDWRCYTSININIKDQTFAVYKKVGSLVTITDAGWASWVAPYDAKISDGVSAYIVTEIASDKVMLTEVENIPEGTPVLLNGTEGLYGFGAAETLDNVADNLLQAADGNVKGNGSIYALGKNNAGQIGFNKVAEDVVVPAGKAYLVVTATVRDFLAFANGEADGINAVDNGQLIGNVVYDLSGRRVEKAVKGIYIVNGKKVVK